MQLRGPRPGRPAVTSLNESLPAIRGAMGRTVGQPVPLDQVCDYCAGNNGPSPGCYIVPGYLGGKCSNGAYKNCNCSLNPPKPKEGSESDDSGQSGKRKKRKTTTKTVKKPRRGSGGGDHGPRGKKGGGRDGGAGGQAQRLLAAGGIE